MPALRRSALITLAVRSNLVVRLWFSHLRVCHTWHVVSLHLLPALLFSMLAHGSYHPWCVLLLALQGMQAEAGRALPPHISEWGPPLVLLARVHRYALSGGQEVEPGPTYLLLVAYSASPNTQDFPEIATCAQHVNCCALHIHVSMCT